MSEHGQKASLFRKKYRPLKESEAELHDAIKDAADELARLIASIPTQPPARESVPKSGTPEAMLHGIADNRGANVTLALRHLEDAVYRAVKALTT